MTAPASATAAAARKAACVPLINAARLRVAITPAIRGGVPAVTSAAPTATALFAAANWAGPLFLT